MNGFKLENVDFMTELYVPVNKKELSSYNGGEVPIFAPDSKSIAVWLRTDEFHIPHGCKYVGVFGLFWLHLGSLKRKNFIKECDGYMTLSEYCESDDIFSRIRLDEYGQTNRTMKNIRPNFKADCVAIKQLVQYLKYFTTNKS